MVKLWAYMFPKLFLAYAPPSCPAYIKRDPECLSDTCLSIKDIKMQEKTTKMHENETHQTKVWSPIKAQLEVYKNATKRLESQNSYLQCSQAFWYHLYHPWSDLEPKKDKNIQKLITKGTKPQNMDTAQ